MTSTSITSRNPGGAQRKHRRRNRRAILTLAAVLGAMLLLMAQEFFVQMSGASVTDRSRNGVLDVSDWAPADDGPIHLQAQWQFHWLNDNKSSSEPKQPATHVSAPPHLWDKQQNETGAAAFPTTGTGVYNLQLKLPDSDTPLAIHIERQMLTFRLFVNDRLAAVSGNSRLDGKPAPRNGDAIAFLPANSRQVQLRLEITNHDHYSGGFRQRLTLDTATNIATWYDTRHIIALLTAAICFAVSLFALLMTGTGRHMKDYVWLALFALLVTFRISLNINLFGDLFPALSISLVLRLNFFAQFALAVVYLSYHHSLFPRYSFLPRLPAWLQPWHLLRGIMMAACAMSLVLPTDMVSQLREPFLILSAGAFVYLVYMLARAARDGRRSATLMLIMTLVLVTGFTHDALLAAGILFGQEWFALAFLGFVLGQAFILAGRTTYAFRQVGELRDAFFDLNQDLEARIIERTRELEEAKEAADAGNLAKSRFLATISHEIRTPMNGLTGVLDLLNRRDLSREQKELVQMATESADSLLVLINDVLDFSKIEAGKLDLEIVESSLTAILESASGLMATSAQTKGLSLITDIQPDLDVNIFTDPTRLRQILLNLLGNAIKFTEQGQIILRASHSPEAADKRLLIEVLDTGIGLNDEARDRLFQPFEQADDSTTRRFGGTGLGLSICQTLAELLGGEIGGDNRENGGSRFWLYLPARLSPLAATNSPLDLSGKTAGLLVNDAALRSSLIRHLQHMGITCTTPLSVTGESSCDIYLVYCHNDGGDLHIPDPLVLAAENVLLLVNGSDKVDPALANKSSRIISLPLKRDALTQAIQRACNAGSVDTDHPLALSDDEPAQHIRSFDDALRDGTAILVAEDNKINRQLLRIQLAQLGYACEMVPDGKAALDFLAVHPVALLLSDYHMPGMNGVDLTRAIRQREKNLDLPRLPVIGLTAAASQEEIAFLTENGMDAAITKPIDFSLLAATLQHYLPLPAQSPPPMATVMGDPTTDHADILLDHSVLEAFFGDDIGAMKDMLLSFLDHNRDSLKAIFAAIDQQDRDAVFHATHSIRGSSGSIGMHALGDYAAMMNDLADTGKHAQYDWETARNHIKRLDMLIRQTSDEVDNL